MKLYLSSFRLGNQVAELRGLAGSHTHFALVPNALDCIDNADMRQAVIDRGISDLVDLGFTVTIIDLREHFHSFESLSKKLEPFNSVFVTGGNVFVLRRAMAYSGFDNWIWSRKCNEDFLYASYSAGSCICAQTLQGLHLVDDPHIVPPGYQPDIIFSGLSLIPYSFIPHYKSNHHESEAIAKVVDFCHREQISYRTYSDGDVLIQNTQQSTPADGSAATEP
jgi:dipeptidase E